MAAKMYWPTLVYMLKRVCAYIARYRQTILNHLPEGAGAALDGIVMACDIFIALTGDNTGD